jgi:hypothetical protein
MDAQVVIMSARVDTTEGVPAALIERVDVGGGEQIKTVDGKEEPFVHERSTVFHVRLYSPDKSFPDELRDAETYEDACKLGLAYAGKLSEHAQRIAKLAQELKV